MNHGKHAYMMLGIAAVGAVLFLTGNAGGLPFQRRPIACMAMMVWMMWSMRGMGSNSRDPVEHTHDNDRDLTHAHK